MKSLKGKKFLVTIFATIFLLNISLVANTNANERIAYNNKMHNGKNIYYWVDSSCQYKVSIPQAVSKLRYPKGMWNPIVLNKTTKKPASKMDLYQYNTRDGANAYTQRFKAKTNGTENIMTIAEADRMDWIYGKIYINDNYMDKYDNDLRSTIILHEMCHVYGGKDVYDRTDTIMYGMTPYVRGMTKDFNDVLVNKYR